MNYDLIYFMGDSYTRALGQLDDLKSEINETNRFCDLIGKKYNLPIVNHGMPGCSNYHIFKTVYNDIYNFIKQGKKVLAVISYTSVTRVDMFHKEKNTYLPISPDFSFYKDYMVEYFDTDFCTELTTNYILAIHTLFDRFNIDYVEAHTLDPILDIPYDNNEHCLDKSFLTITGLDGRFTQFGHANVLGNARIAEEFIKKIDQLYGTN